MVTVHEIGEIVAQVLQIQSRMDSFTGDTALLGSIPEFDSMAVVSVLTAIEENYGLIIDDDEVTAEVFATLGTLTGFVRQQAAD
ncbi:MAG: hypothetical protein KDI16_10810 [Halioglobus sp.]|nr:hypothetical protein [Halioglobus sp.]